MSFFIHQQEMYKMKHQEYNVNSFNWMNELLNFQQKLWNPFNVSSSTHQSTEQEETKKTCQQDHQTILKTHHD